MEKRRIYGKVLGLGDYEKEIDYRHGLTQIDTEEKVNNVTLK
jgi:hypothetical protein